VNFARASIVALLFWMATPAMAAWNTYVEPPPPGYGVPPPGHLLEITLPYDTVQKVCGGETLSCAQPDGFRLQLLLMSPDLPQEWRALVTSALAFDPAYKAIVLPNCGLFERIDCDTRDELRRHEWAHDWGLVHCDNGRGWCTVVAGAHDAGDLRRCAAWTANETCVGYLWLRRVTGRDKP
jgi:hypothetical protein